MLSNQRYRYLYLQIIRITVGVVLGLRHHRRRRASAKARELDRSSSWCTKPCSVIDNYHSRTIRGSGMCAQIANRTTLFLWPTCISSISIRMPKTTKMNQSKPPHQRVKRKHRPHRQQQSSQQRRTHHDQAFDHSVATVNCWTHWNVVKRTWKPAKSHQTRTSQSSRITHWMPRRKTKR